MSVSWSTYCKFRVMCCEIFAPTEQIPEVHGNHFYNLENTENFNQNLFKFIIGNNGLFDRRV